MLSEALYERRLAVAKREFSLVIESRGHHA